MSPDTMQLKYDTAVTSINERAMRASARSFAAGAAILAFNSDGFLTWGRRARFFCFLFACAVPNYFVMKFGLGWF